MLMPSIFGENLFDDFMDFPFGGKKINTMMKTDIRDTDSSYELDIDMPGFKKEDIKAQLKDGYLTISASTSANNDEQDKDGRYPPGTLCGLLQQKLLCGRRREGGGHPGEV